VLFPLDGAARHIESEIKRVEAVCDHRTPPRQAPIREGPALTLQALQPNWWCQERLAQVTLNTPRTQ